MHNTDAATALASRTGLTQLAIACFDIGLMLSAYWMVGSERRTASDLALASSVS
jgi:hypothetical protein